MAKVKYLVDVEVSGSVIANSFAIPLGLSTEFLKANGSVDANSYALVSQLHNPVTLGTANGLSLSTQVLSLGLSSTSTTGSLSSTDWNTFNNKQAALGYTPENIANKNAANGYAGLGTDGKILSSLLPAITITDTFVVASEAAMLAIQGQTGDVAVRSDLNKSFILKGADPTVLTDWQELLTPTSAVTSVFGRAGAVTAQSGDYNADQITETARLFVSAAEKATWNEKQAALNGTGFVKSTAGVISYDNTSYLPLTGGTMSGELTFSDDGEGITLFGGARIYKKSGTGIVVRLHNGNIRLQAENNAGTILGTYAYTSEIPTNLNQLATRNFSDLQSKPTTLAGYGITDALLSSSYTASDVLTKIKTVDGSGSGLDADLLDGLHASDFQTSGKAWSSPSSLATDIGNEYTWYNAAQLTYNSAGIYTFYGYQTSLSFMVDVRYQNGTLTLVSSSIGPNNQWSPVVGARIIYTSDNRTILQICVYTSTLQVWNSVSAYASSKSTVFFNALITESLSFVVRSEIILYGSLQNNTQGTDLLRLAGGRMSGNLNLSNLTASQSLELDASKNIISVAKATGYNQAFSTVAADIKMNGIQSLGLLSTLARADHVHPTDTTRQAVLSNPLTGVGSNLDPNAYALQDGTILYHSVKWFIPTGTVSTSGTTVTSVGTQFTNAMVGAKLTINGEWRIITGYTNTATVTVASAYSQNYSGVVAGSWGVYSKSLSFALEDNPNGSYTLYDRTKAAILINSYGYTSANQFSTSSGQMTFSGTFANFANTYVFNWSSTPGHSGTKDLGLRRNTAGLLELYNGVTADGSLLNRRDLLVRNVYSEPATLPNQVVTKSQLDLKADLGNAFTAGRVPYTSSTSAISDSSKLLWNNTNSYFEVNGNAPRFTLKNNLNNFSTYFTNDANGTLFLKNHQDKTLAAFNNPVNSTEQPQMAIGKVSSIPVESQLYVYGGMNGANIDARGSIDRDEANIDLEGNDWETSPNSLGFSYFGSNATSFGTVLGYAKNKLGVIRFQDTNYAIINSDKSTGISPIRFGINQIEIGNVNDKGFSYQSDFSSVNSSNPRWLTDKGYVDTKAPLTGTGASGTWGINITGSAPWSGITSKPTTLAGYGITDGAPLSGSANYIQNQTTSAQSANMWINGSIKAKNIQTLDDVNGFYTYGRYSSGQPYSLNVLSAAAQGFKFTNSSVIPLLTIESSGAATFSSTITATNASGTYVRASNTVGGYAEIGITPNAASNGYINFTNSLAISGGNVTFSNLASASNGTLIGGTLTSGYIPKATGANSLGNSLIFDNGTNIGIGTTSPSAKLHVKGSSNLIRLQDDGAYLEYYNTANTVRTGYTQMNSASNARISVEIAQGLSIYTSASERMTITSSGNVGIGTTSPSEKLEVIGTIKATSFNGSATLTGTPTAPTAAPGTTGNQIANLDFVLANTTARPYKVWTSLVTQINTAIPSPTILENTLGGTITWSRSGVGLFIGTLAGAFTASKTCFLATLGIVPTSGGSIISITRTSIDTILIRTTNSSGSVTDGILDNALIEIRVYN